jgi:hypothetical protein
MTSSTVMDQFIQKRPLCVMTRCILGHVMSQDLDQVFAQHRQRQYEQELTFAALAASVADVTLGFCDNFNQAYSQHRQELAVSLTAYYGKINRVATPVSEGVVAYAGEKAGELLQALGVGEWQVLKGYKCSVLDGNHLQKTEKRLGVLRGLCAAALPGTVVAKYNLQTELFERAYLLEDAHAQESTVLDRVVADLEQKELLLADRHFCITKFLLDVADKQSCFVIRQHGRLHGQLQGKRRKIDRIETGEVFQQKLRITDKESGRTLTLRRITIELDEPTRDGDTELHILSNVPAADATACQLAQLYRERWEIENAFHVLTMTLTCEVKSIGQPCAALFLFCLALLAYNCRQVLLGALWTAHAPEDVQALSHFSIALEIERAMDGLLTAIPASDWDRQVPATVAGRVTFLRRVAKHVDVRAHRKTVRGPKKPKPPRKRCTAGTHVSTHRLLQTQNQRC